MSFFKRKEKNLIPPVASGQASRDELFGNRSRSNVSPQPPSSRPQAPSYSSGGDPYGSNPAPPSRFEDRYTKKDAVGDVYARGQGNVDNDRNELFSGYKPPERSAAGSGRFFEGGPPRGPEPNPGEENEEDVEGIKQQMRYTKQESVNSTRNALRLAREAEETARNTLGRLGDQSGTIWCLLLLIIYSLLCLRQAPYAKIFEHANTVNNFFGFRSLASAWTLRPDGKFLTESPDKLVAAGKIANVPILYGDMENEGTLFCLLNQVNITTTELVKDYFKTYWWPKVSEQQLDRLMELYPTTIDNFPADGLPQYERLSALVGDYSFEAQRRSLLAAHRAPKWNYHTKFSVPLSVVGDTLVGKLLGRLKATNIPILGSFHASDVFFYFFGTIPDTVSNNSRHLMGALVHFVHDLDPNHSEIPQWPQWDSGNLETMHFQEEGLELIKENYRKDGMDYINQIKDDIRI